jgi:hypothetical protein
MRWNGENDTGMYRYLVPCCMQMPRAKDARNKQAICGISTSASTEGSAAGEADKSAPQNLYVLLYVSCRLKATISSGLPHGFRTSLVLELCKVQCVESRVNILVWLFRLLQLQPEATPRQSL